MTLRNEKKKKIKTTQEEENKEGGNQELPSEKTAFKKRLVEIKWFISGEKDILATGMEEELQTQWMLRTLKKITLKLKKEQNRNNSLINKVD